MHGICITEKLSGTFNGADLVSVRYMVGNTPTAIDNGSVVEVGALEANSREVRKATAPKKDAAKAAKMLKAKHVIPVHYDTWPVIAQDPEVFKDMVEAQCDSQVHIMKPGDALDIDKL